MKETGPLASGAMVAVVGTSRPMKVTASGRTLDGGRAGAGA
ncbi:MAG TPA: hypothetical protein VMU95_22275 [Trebonia sp.]|nr:hypothetical protein [Trebonia sp.]